MAKEKVEKMTLLEFDNSKLSTKEHPRGAMIIFKTRNSEIGFEMTSRGLFVSGFARKNGRNVSYKKESFTLNKLISLMGLIAEEPIQGSPPPRNARTIKRK